MTDNKFSSILNIKQNIFLILNSRANTATALAKPTGAYKSQDIVQKSIYSTLQCIFIT